MASLSKEKTVLITGINGFTGVHLRQQLLANGYKVYGLANTISSVNSNDIKCDITDLVSLKDTLNLIKPNYIVHLAAVTFVPHENYEEIYRVNLFGTINLLQAITDIGLNPKKILIASSANVYGSPPVEVVDETVCPSPINHYANSKLAMENVARTWFDKLPIIIVRPFNYTGVGQSEKFLIPKIVKHYQLKKRHIELGNIEVTRDFSDIRFVINIYRKLLESDFVSGVVNVCSGIGHSIYDILRYMNIIANYEICVKVNHKLIREQDIKVLIGSNERLFNLIGEQKIYNLSDTLSEMYRHEDE